MKRLFKFKYPKLVCLLIFSLISYFIFKNVNTQHFVFLLGNLGFISYFLVGILFSFGFTTPFAIGFFVTANPPNIFLTALIAGLGGLVADWFIFKTIKLSFMDEFLRLKKSSPGKILNNEIKKDFSKRVRNYLLYTFAGFAIASPLPDEFGVTMLAGLTHIKPFSFAVISFIMKFLGALIILSI